LVVVLVVVVVVVVRIGCALERAGAKEEGRQEHKI
jgi:hypothetical protein